jgi:hypothetical protein
MKSSDGPWSINISLDTFIAIYQKYTGIIIVKIETK